MESAVMDTQERQDDVPSSPSPSALPDDDTKQQQSPSKQSTESVKKPSKKKKNVADPKQKKKIKRKVEFKGKSAYQIFQDEYRPKIRSENPEANFGEISSLVAKAWKSLSAEEKEVYENKSKEDKESRKKVSGEPEDSANSNSNSNEIMIPKIANLKDSGDDGPSPSKSKRLKKASTKLFKDEQLNYDDDSDEQKEKEKPSEEVKEEPTGTAFDQVVEQSKSRKRKSQLDPELIDEATNTLLQQMQNAYLEDLSLIKSNQPATKKLLLVKEVVNMASKKQFQKPLMDNGFLSQVRNWLLPLSDGSLPSSILRDNLYTLLQTLPTEFTDEPMNSRASANEHIDNISLLEYLRESADEHGEGLGKVLLDLWRKENVQYKPMLRDIIERWARPLFGSSTNYKELAEVEAEKAQKIFHRSRRLSSGQPEMRIQTHHARLPQKATFDYAIRPESHIAESESNRRAAADEVESETHQRIQKKLVTSFRKKTKTRR